MNTQKIKEKFNLINLELLSTKSENIFFVEGKLSDNEALLSMVIKNIDSRGVDLWESYFKNTWRTFIKLYSNAKFFSNKTIINKYKMLEKSYEDSYVDEYMDEGLWMTMDAYEYDGPKDRDSFERWLEGNGY